MYTNECIQVNAKTLINTLECSKWKISIIDNDNYNNKTI